MLRLRTLGLLAAAAALPAAILSSAGAAGPNLLTNGSFSAGTSGWSVWSGIPGTIAANPDQTLSVTNTSAPTITSDAAAVQCVSGVSGGTAYTLKADTYVPAGQSRHGGADTRLFWYSGPSCSGPLLSSPFGSQFVTTLGAWVTVQTTFVAPASAGSVLVMLATEQYKADPGENPAAHFVTKWDNASFAALGAVIDTPPVQPTPPTPVPTIIVPLVPGTPVATPSATPVVPPVTTPSATPTAPTTPTVTVTQQPVVTATATPATPSSTQPTTDTPDETTPEAGAPLPPNTGSGTYGADSGLPLFELALGAIGLVALGGLILSVAAAAKRQ